jgi:hypothetical protein
MSAAPDPGELNDLYRRYLAAVLLFHRAAVEASGLGITDYQASSLLDLDQPLTNSRLAERLGISAAAATRVVDRLVGKGLARRIADPSDRRRVLIEHTGLLPEGLGRGLGGVRSHISAVVDQMTQEQVQGLVAYFRAAHEAYTAGARQFTELREEGEEG